MYDEEGNLKRKFIIAIPIVVVIGVVIMLLVANWYRGKSEKVAREKDGTVKNVEIVTETPVEVTEKPELSRGQAVREYIDSKIDMPKYVYKEVDTLVSICVSNEGADPDNETITYDMLDSEFSSVNEKYYLVFQGMRIIDNYEGYVIYGNEDCSIIMKDNQNANYKSWENIPLQKCNLKKVDYEGNVMYLTTLGTEEKK